MTALSLETERCERKMLEPIAQLVDWCLGRVHLYIGRHGLRLTYGGGQLGDLYVGVDEVKHALQGGHIFDLATRLGLPQPVEPGHPPRSPGSPLARIIERFGLDQVETALLVAAAGPAMSIDVDRLYTFAWADFTVKMPTAAFLSELITDEAATAASNLVYLRPDGQLRRAGLLALEAPTGRASTKNALAHHGVFVPEPVLTMLRNEPPLSLAHAILHPPAPQKQRFDPPADATARLDALLDAGVSPIVLRGPPGCGRREATRLTCGRRRMALLEVDLAKMPDDDARFTEVLAEVLLDARLYDVPLLLRADELFDGDDARRSALARVLKGHVGIVVIATQVARGGTLIADTRAAVVDVSRADSAAQRFAWMSELGSLPIAERLTARFDVTLGNLIEACEDARRMNPGVALDADAVSTTLRRRTQHALDGLSEHVHTSLGWEDVVLPADVSARLHEIRLHAEHRGQVFDGWGFRRKMSYGRGLSCLFSGPPGTGKTMMAGIIANDLGRELYKVDLSRVVSKWVGETEKNLSRIFDEAEKAQVILFFDEADSLFAARTEVKGANDRFANMEVNYLLQRMEQYDGVSILTTNFDRGLDEAFRRRLRFRVHFPLPDSAQRTELWRRMIPAEMPADDDIDFERLGRKYKMSGGSIKSAVLRAAFYAADEGGALTAEYLSTAADAESREMGRL